jgi:dipeptidyl aminopeptidase/acylaminoacyl peptidase
MTVSSKLLGRLSAAWLALAACAAGAEPITVDRLLKLEDFGVSALSPDGKHLVVETRAPYETAPTFDFETADASLGRLMVADLAADTPARPLLAPEDDTGYTAGPFSPSGRKMIVSRWRNYRWEAGVVDVATGAASWLGFGIDQPLYGRTAQWLSDTAFVAIAVDVDKPPIHLQMGWRNQASRAALWAQQAAGQVATINVIGSGRARREEPRTDRRLMRVDLATGARTLLATGGFFDMELSPSRRFVAVLGEAERIGLVATPAVRMGAPSRRRALSIVNLETGSITSPCVRCTTLIQPFAWSRATDKLLVFQHDVGRAEAEGHLQVVDAADGRVTPVAKTLQLYFDYGNEGFAMVRADWLGSHPIALGRLPGGARDDWYDLARAAPLNLTSALPTSPKSLAFGKSGQLLAMSGNSVWRLDGDGRAQALRATGKDWFRPAEFAIGFRINLAPFRSVDLRLRSDARVIDLAGHGLSAPDGARPIAAFDGALVFEQHEQSGLARVAITSKGDRHRELVTVNSAASDLGLGSVRTIKSRAPDGTVLKSWIYLPEGWRPGLKPPMVVVPYPGSAPQTLPSRFVLRSNNLTPNPQLLAAQGYAVLLPALPRDRTLGEPAQGLADQILAVVDEAIAKGLADPDRLALWGHSFGGYSALATATQTARFKAIVAQAGSVDYVMRWAGIQPHYVTAPADGSPSPVSMGYNETGQGGLKGPPWQEPSRYLRNSPLFQADKITTPVMLIYGDQDFVDLTQGQAMFNALYRQDKDATLLTLFGEGHLPTSPANVRAIYAQVLPWLADRLASPSVAAAREDPRPSQ